MAYVRPLPAVTRAVQGGPGLFRVAVSAAAPQVLVFSDSYDPRWVATQHGQVLPHVKANGFANGWLVEDPAAGPIELRFLPQRLFALAVWISIAVAVSLLCAIACVTLLPGWQSARKRGLLAGGNVREL